MQFRQQEHKLACWANYSDSSSSSTATASAGRMDGRGSIYQRSTFTKLEFGTKITEFDLCLIISRYLKNITDDMYLLVGTYVNMREYRTRYCLVLCHFHISKSDHKRIFIYNKIFIIHLDKTSILLIYYSYKMTGRRIRSFLML